MKLYFQSIPDKIKSIYILWISINFVLLMLEGGVLNYDSTFFPFGFHFFDFDYYDYTEFIVYTVVPILLHYSYWLWSKAAREKKDVDNISKEKVCSNCSSSIPVDSEFCTNCDNPITHSEKNKPKIGIIFKIITVLVVSIVIIFVIATNIFTKSSPSQTNRDAVIVECTNLATLAQQYYRKPVALSGGGNSFIGWEMPRLFQTTASGAYAVDYVSSESIALIGTGNEIGNDGTNKVRVTMIVGGTGIISTTTNN